MKRKHNVDEVSRSLNKKTGECKVITSDKIVVTKKNCQTLGNGSWGKIDFLCNHNGYTHYSVPDIENFLNERKKLSYAK